MRYGILMTDMLGVKEVFVLSDDEFEFKVLDEHDDIMVINPINPIGKKLTEKDMVVLLAQLCPDSRWEIKGTINCDLELPDDMNRIAKKKLCQLMVMNTSWVFGNNEAILIFKGGNKMNDEILHVLAGVTLYDVFNKPILLKSSPLEYILMQKKFDDKIKETLLNYVDTITFKYADGDKVTITGDVCQHPFSEIRTLRSKSIQKSLKEYLERDFADIDKDISLLASDMIAYADAKECNGTYAVAGKVVVSDIFSTVNEAEGF